VDARDKPAHDGVLYQRPLIPGTSQASRLSRLSRGPDLALK
jgi:hypothetical protein